MDKITQYGSFFSNRSDGNLISLERHFETRLNVLCKIIDHTFVNKNVDRENKFLLCFRRWLRNMESVRQLALSTTPHFPSCRNRNSLVWSFKPILRLIKLFAVDLDLSVTRSVFWRNCILSVNVCIVIYTIATFRLFTVWDENTETEIIMNILSTLSRRTTHTVWIGLF